MKSTLAAGRVVFNANAFYTEVENYQTNVNLAAEIVPRRRNVGTLETAGFETDLRWLITEAFEVRWSLGYVDAEISEVARDAAGNFFEVDGVPILGNRPVNTPEWSSALVLDFSRPITNSLVLDLMTGINWNGDRYLEIENGADHLVDSYVTVDASISIGSQDGEWEASLWGRNITDEDYLRYINDVPAFGFFLAINSQPATYGVSVQYNFY